VGRILNGFNRPSARTAQPTGPQCSSALAVLAQRADNDLRRFARTRSSDTALAIASRADCGICRRSMYRSSVVGASSVFDSDQCSLLFMSAF